MRKSIPFEVCGEEFTVPVNFDAIEKLERVFQANADMITSVILPNNINLRYTTLATAVAEVIVPHLGASKLTRQDIKEYVLQCSPEEMGRFVLMLSTMCLYLRKHLAPENFDKVVEEVKGVAKKPVTSTSSSPDQPSSPSTDSPSASGESPPQNSGE